MRRGHTEEKSLQALAKQDLLKGASICKLKFCEHCVIEKKTKVIFDIATHCTEGILDYVHKMSGDLPRRHLLAVTNFLSFLDDYSRRCWLYTMKHKREVLKLFVE